MSTARKIEWLRASACMFMLVVASGFAGATPGDAEDDKMLASCPGGAEWLASEHARREEMHLPPEAPPRKPELRDELLRMARDDQAARSALTEGKTPTQAQIEAWQSTDRRNLAALKKIVADGGFPRAADVRRDGVGAAWLLVQHADADPAFQQSVLSQLTGLGEADGIGGQEVALLTDRVLLAQGKPQRYGTQYEGGAGSPLRQRPMEDPSHVDERRAAMHMMPIATYACVLDKMYGGHATR
ncbi:MAG TPA: DUF6624 domain-containing protein [Luteimonas sp.]|nr:DUF6624 domain-containing protein [Luteimonas sp.]